MARTDAEAVRAITSTEKTDDEIAPFITAASCVIDEIVDGGCASGISEACLAQAEAFVTAHIMATSGSGTAGGDAQIKRETFENYTVELMRGAQGEGILATSYGQTANLLTGGCLVTLHKPKPLVKFF